MIRNTITGVGYLHFERGESLLFEGERWIITDVEDSTITVKKWRWYHTLRAWFFRLWCKWGTVTAVDENSITVDWD